MRRGESARAVTGQHVRYMGQIRAAGVHRRTWGGRAWAWQLDVRSCRRAGMCVRARA